MIKVMHHSWPCVFIYYHNLKKIGAFLFLKQFNETLFDFALFVYMANRYNFIINAVQRKIIQAYPICLYETNKQTNKQTNRQTEYYDTI